MTITKRRPKKIKKRINQKIKGRKNVGLKQRRSHRTRHRRSKNTKNKVKKRLATFQSVTKKIKKNMLIEKPTNIDSALKLALKTVNENNINGSIKAPPRVIKIPKTGGILPLIPIFAALSALGALSGGAAGIAKPVNDARAAKQQLTESQRHHKSMESIALGKGLYLRPYKTGLGLFF